MRNAEQPINPTYVNNGDFEFVAKGLTKREYFAGQMLAGIFSNENCTVSTKHPLNNGIVSKAIEYADELLKQLESCADTK